MRTALFSEFQQIYIISRIIIIRDIFPFVLYYNFSRKALLERKKIKNVSYLNFAENGASFPARC